MEHIDYYDMPYSKDKNNCKDEIFDENSRKSYFGHGLNSPTYLFDFDEIPTLLMKAPYGRFVLVVYKRYAIVKKNGDIWINQNFNDGHEPPEKTWLEKGGKYKILYVGNYKDSDQEGLFKAVLDGYHGFATANEAIEKAVEYSVKNQRDSLVCQLFIANDRY